MTTDTDTDIIRQLPPRDQETLRLAEEMADAACGCEAGAFIDRQRKALIAHLSAAPQASEPAAPAAGEVAADIVRDAERYRWLRTADGVPISSKAARDPVAYDAAIDAAIAASKGA